MHSKTIEQFWGEIACGSLEYLIVDLPPGTSDAALTVMQSLPMDAIVLVTSPKDLAGMVVRKPGDMANQLGIPLIGLVENMSHIVCPKCSMVPPHFGESNAGAVAEALGTSILGHIPLDPKLAVL